MSNEMILVYIAGIITGLLISLTINNIVKRRIDKKYEKMKEDHDAVFALTKKKMMIMDIQTARQYGATPDDVCARTEESKKMVSNLLRESRRELGVSEDE